MKEYDKCMEVWFPSTLEEDVLLLKNVDDDESVLEGHFENEVEVEISISIDTAGLGLNITVRYIINQRYF